MEFLKDAFRHTIGIVDLFEGKLRAVKLDKMHDSGGASAEFADDVEGVVIDDGDVREAAIGGEIGDLDLVGGHREMVAADKGDARDDGADAFEIGKEKGLTIELAQFETVRARNLFAAVCVLDLEEKFNHLHDE